MPAVEIEKPVDAPASEPVSTVANSEKAVEKKMESKENLGVIEDIKKTINEIRLGVRSNIASLWQGFKNLISKGFDKLFGTTEKPAETKPEAKPATDDTSAKPAYSSPADSSNTTDTNQSVTNATNPETATEKPKLEESETFKKVMETYAKEIKDPVKNVLYPASGYMSINDSIKDAKITYVDTDEGAVNTHKEAGHTAVKEDMGNYTPEEKPDLTILLNARTEDEKIKKLLDHVETGKHIICNNHFGTAELLHGNENMQLVGVINPNGSKMDKENLDDYFKLVETDEEFKTTDSTQYDKAVVLIKEKNGNAEKDILKQFKELTKDDTSGLYRIPFKKGGTLDYFVFKRVAAPKATTKPATKPKPTQNPSTTTHQAA